MCRPMFSRFLLLMLFVSIGGCATRPAAPGISDAQARRLIDAYEQARERRDPDALRMLLTDEIDQLTSSGQWRRGIDTALAGMRQSSEQNPGRRTLTVETVRSLSPTVALVDARYTIAEPDGTERQLWSSFLLVRSGTDLRIAAIRNMRPASP